MSLKRAVTPSLPVGVRVKAVAHHCRAIDTRRGCAYKVTDVKGVTGPRDMVFGMHKKRK